MTWGWGQGGGAEQRGEPVGRGYEGLGAEPYGLGVGLGEKGWVLGESQWGEAMKGLGAGPGDLGVGPRGGGAKGGASGESP